ncbi:Gag-pol fusion protein [Phytophthora megakarya]|uniref:Gag-pol fusion protein n=1 Tax=Phytophthora megakarya TaxID=4795 RepID=A0A225WT64_9STRA|nr:Gag-pol fusion protein [Phytophthora megakarya]
MILTYLGHIATPSGILRNPEKVKVVINVKRPHDLHTRLKVKGTEFVWAEDGESAFLQLKRRLIEPPILIYPNFSKRFKLYVDSSK